MAEGLVKPPGRLNFNEISESSAVAAQPLGARFDKTFKLLRKLRINPDSIYGHTIVGKGYRGVFDCLFYRRKRINYITLLHYVCEKGKTEVLKELLQQKCDLEIRGCGKDKYCASSSTPLHIAACFGQDECLKLLIEAGADVNCKNGVQDTPLQVAGAHNRSNCLKQLIAHGANIDAQITWGYFLGTTVFHAAAGRGYLASLKELIQLRGDVNANDKYNETPLHWAARFGQLDSLKELIKHNADVNAQDQWNETPLHVAAREGELKCLKTLMKAGADPKIKNIDGETVMDVANSTKQTGCAKYLRTVMS